MTKRLYLWNIFIGILKKGKGKSEALDETINFFKNNPNKNLRSPYIWAAFQLSGDWRPIKF